jgi:hypothetical protein
MYQAWFREVNDQLRASRQLQVLGFEAREINWHDAGADRSPLLQIAREPPQKNEFGKWRLDACDATEHGFQAVWFHYECRQPGDWRIDCEFWPRKPKHVDANLRHFQDMIALKRELTQQLIDHGHEHDWPRRFGANRDRAPKLDLGDPSSLMVWKFYTGLDDTSAPDAFVAAIIPIIQATAPAIDEICGHVAPSQPDRLGR